MWRVRGQDRVLKQIDKSFAEGRYAHAYLLVGPPGVGKRTLAFDMAQAVNCLSLDEVPCGECSQCRRIVLGQHTDVQVLEVRKEGGDGPPRREVGIDEVRELQRRASLNPYEGRERVFIFDGAESMSEAAANALLKTLEEPPPQVLMLLTTSREEALLPTIRSRCRRLELRPLPMTEVAAELVNSHSVGQDEAEKLARLSMGCLGWAISTLTDPSIIEQRNEELESISRLSEASLEDRFSYASELASLFYRNRESALEVLYRWLRWWRDLLLIEEGGEEFVHNVDWRETLRELARGCTVAQVVAVIKAILRTVDALEQNANARLALEVLMLSLPTDRSRV